MTDPPNSYEPDFTGKALLWLQEQGKFSLSCKTEAWRLSIELPDQEGTVFCDYGNRLDELLNDTISEILIMREENDQRDTDEL